MKNQPQPVPGPPSSTLTPEGFHPFPSPAPPSLLRLRGAPTCLETDPRGRCGLFGQGSGVPGPWHAGRVGARVGMPLPTVLPNPPCPTSHGEGRGLRNWWGLHSCWPLSVCFSPILVCFHHSQLSGVILFIYCFHLFIINLPY